MVEQGEYVVIHEAKTSIFRFISLAHFFKAERYHMASNTSDHAFTRMAKFLYNLNFKISVVNPMQIKAFRKSRLIRQKTESVDTQMIAEFCQTNNSYIWTPRSPDKKELPEINHQVESLKSN